MSPPQTRRRSRELNFAEGVQGELRRIVSGRSSKKDCSTKFGPNVVTLHVPDPTLDERLCLPCLFWHSLTDPWHQRARGPGSARLQALSVSPGDDPEPLALVRL